MKSDSDPFSCHRKLYSMSNLSDNLENLKFSWCNGIQIDRDTRQIFSPDLSELLERIKLAQIRYSRRPNEKGLKEMQLFELILTNCNVRSLFEIKWMHKVEHTTKLFNFLFDTCNYKQQAICIISTMHLLFSNFKKQANSFPLGKLFLCSCFYNNMHVLVPAYTTLTKFFPQTKTFITMTDIGH